MVSIEAYRASIGRYYSRAKLLSSNGLWKVEDNLQQHCCCSLYDSVSFSKETDTVQSSAFKTLCMFYDYFREYYEQIEMEFESWVDEVKIGFFAYLFDCYAKIIEVVESYDASFLKVLKLLID